MFNRIIDLSELPANQSVFLFGARGTGKSTFLKQKYPKAIYYDLLKGEEYGELLARPWTLRERLVQEPAALLSPVIIDEVQKIPQLLDEVHWLIENKKIGFILCGSSARKLKRGAANLLGGRALDYKFYPLVYKEIPDFDLLRVFKHGLLPTNYLAPKPQRYLQTYVNMYLKEEVQEEGLVRNLPGFARFLEVAAFSNGELLNYNNIARDCWIDAKTVHNYYQILSETLLGYFVQPFTLKKKRDLITATPKFYLFDIGVSNYLAKKNITSLHGFDAGLSLEHFIFLELTAYIGINGINDHVEFWRSKSGLEVDFILDRGRIAIEVKLTAAPATEDLHGLLAFIADYNPEHRLVVCNAPHKRLVTTESGVTFNIVPWKNFLDELWAGKYFS